MVGNICGRAAEIDALFLFQAEDGIRDYKVTGVQTCALPIWLSLLTLALYAATPEQSPVGDGFIWQLPAAIVCFGLFVWHERRSPHPLINVRRFREDRKSVV